MVEATGSLSVDMVEHPAASVFPLMVGAEFEALRQDIRANGQLEAIVIDAEGRVLDGRNRWRACRAIGVVPQTDEWSGGDAVAFVLSKNLHRRHLDESQRAMIAARLANMAAGDNQYSRSGRSAGPAEKGNPQQLISQKEAAKMLNSSERLVRRATQVITSGDDGIIAAVDAGEMSVGRAAQEISRRSEDVPPRGQTGLDKSGPGTPMEILVRMTAEDVVEKIDGLMRDGATQAKATKQFGIDETLFAKLRYIVRLVGHDGLSDNDASIARQALTAVDATKQITPAYKSVETLVDRVWGAGRARRGRGTDRQKLARRRERFDHSVGVVMESCRAISEIDVPYLSAADRNKIGRNLGRAQANLKEFGRAVNGERL